MMAGNVVWVVVLVTLVICMFASSLVLFVVQYKRRQQIFSMEKSGLEQRYREQLLQTRLEVQEQSLKYFSEEIHDNIGQALTLVKLHLYEVKQLVYDPQASAIVETGADILSKAISDLRNISHLLNGNLIVAEGLEKMLAKELEYLNQSKKLTVTLQTSGTRFFLSAEKELLIFRVVQEAIANAIKHANPQNISVTLDHNERVLTARIADDGCGFVADNVSAPGLGLINMKSRAALLGGDLTIESELNQGTVIQLQIILPYENAN